ncbi:MAG: alanine--tRNA ligase, partial [Planctomycetota bacterium]
RIEAVTGLGAVEAARSAFDALSALSRRLGVRPAEAPERVAALLDEAKALQRELKAVWESSLKKAAADARPRDIAGVPVLALDLGEAEPDVMRSVMDSLKSRVKGGVLLLAGRGKNGVTLILRLDDELVARGWHAGKLIREVAAVIGGKGGGRPQLAQAGGRDAASLPAAFERLEKIVRQTISEGK